ncbi:hypothetical protein FO519_007307 [Halicephalobus sp. NKZ332]|nr:hypothetical protein FO519_007307 [Halicephalobus sp. NKZ332]
MLGFLILLQLLSSSEGTWGTCCSGSSYVPYLNAMTPSGFPIYGMAPYASSSVANSGFPPVYSYGSGGYSSLGAGYPSLGSGYSPSLGSGYSPSMGSGYSPSMGEGINFDSIPTGQIPPGAVVGQPVAVRYFNQPIPVNIDPSALSPLGPTTLMRIPIYGKVKAPADLYSSSQFNEQAPITRYSKPASIHSVDSDLSRGYQPAYSNWNKQPIQAVFRQGGLSSPSLRSSYIPAPEPLSVSETSDSNPTPSVEVSPSTYTKEVQSTSEYKLRAKV